MLDIAEAIFTDIALCLKHNKWTVRETFGGEDVIQVMPGQFEGEANVEVMTGEDFITRCE